MSKKVKVKVTAGFPHCQGERRWDIAIVDGSSGLMICETTLTMENFAFLMSGLGCIEGEGTVYDTYDKLGLKKEWRTVALQDDRLKNYRADQAVFDAVIDAARPEYEIDGWAIDRVFVTSMSQGQLNTTYGTLVVTLVRYVENAEPVEVVKR